MRTAKILLLVVFPVIGSAGLLIGWFCRKTPELDPPGYVLTIPDDVPGEIELIDKDGTRHMGNGRDLYASGHKYGWRTCWKEYERGQIDPKNPDAWENYIPGDYGIVIRGLKDGFKACQETLPNN